MKRTVSTVVVLTCTKCAQYKPLYYTYTVYLTQDIDKIIVVGNVHVYLCVSGSSQEDIQL